MGPGQRTDYRLPSTDYPHRVTGKAFETSPSRVFRTRMIAVRPGCSRAASVLDLAEIRLTVKPPGSANLIGYLRDPITAPSIVSSASFLANPVPTTVTLSWPDPTALT